MKIQMKQGYRHLKYIMATILLLPMLMTGCAGQSSADRTNSITIAAGSDTGSMDPAGTIALTFLSYAASGLDELLTYGEDGQMIYRAASSYEVNEDSTVWTFHLWKDACWSDGSPVTAEDFLNTIRRALDPENASNYVNYLYPIANAEAIYQGEQPMETLGARAVDDYTLEFILTTPCVYFLDLMRLPVYMPSKGELSNGPFAIKEYKQGQYLTLERNKYYRDTADISLDEITYRFFDSQEAMANAYRTGEVDVAAGLQASVMEEFAGKDDLFVTDLTATRYLYPNLNEEPLNDVRVRKALSLALNREEICKAVGKDTEPTVNFVAKSMKNKQSGNNFVDDAEPPFVENAQEARELLAAAGYPDGKGFPVLTYKYPTLEMDSDTAQILQAQWKKELNIEIKLEAQELQVNYSDRRAGEFQLCRMNWTADFADPYTYLSMLLSNSPYNCSGVADDSYDALIQASDIETDPVKRNGLLHEADRIAAGEEFYVIPLYSMRSCNLIRPEISGIRQIAASGALEYRYVSINH